MAKTVGALTFTGPAELKAQYDLLREEDFGEGRRKSENITGFLQGSGIGEDAEALKKLQTDLQAKYAQRREAIYAVGNLYDNAAERAKQKAPGGLVYELDIEEQQVFRNLAKVMNHVTPVARVVRAPEAPEELSSDEEVESSGKKLTPELRAKLLAQAGKENLEAEETSVESVQVKHSRASALEKEHLRAQENKPRVNLVSAEIGPRIKEVMAARREKIAYAVNMAVAKVQDAADRAKERIDERFNLVEKRDARAKQKEIKQAVTEWKKEPSRLERIKDAATAAKTKIDTLKSNAIKTLQAMGLKSATPDADVNVSGPTGFKKVGGANTAEQQARATLNTDKGAYADDKEDDGLRKGFMLAAAAPPKKVSAADAHAEGPTGREGTVEQMIEVDPLLPPDKDVIPGLKQSEFDELLSDVPESTGEPISTAAVDQMLASVDAVASDAQTEIRTVEAQATSQLDAGLELDDSDREFLDNADVQAFEDYHAELMSKREPITKEALMVKIPGEEGPEQHEEAKAEPEKAESAKPAVEKEDWEKALEEMSKELDAKLDTAPKAAPEPPEPKSPGLGGKH